jgi:8-oxo-dGTP diphosphatase
MSDQNMEPKLFVATKAFIVHEGKILILRESGSYAVGTNTGLYDLPGGRLEPGERFNDALKREVLEETGLEVEIGRPVAVNEWRPVVRGEPWQIVGIFFECKATTSHVVVSADHDEYKWIEPADYLNYPIIDNLKPVFEAFLMPAEKNGIRI